jgi:hypothetical protein
MSGHVHQVRIRFGGDAPMVAFGVDDLDGAIWCAASRTCGRTSSILVDGEADDSGVAVAAGQ